MKGSTHAVSLKKCMYETMTDDLFIDSITEYTKDKFNLTEDVL